LQRSSTTTTFCSLDDDVNSSEQLISLSSSQLPIFDGCIKGPVMRVREACRCAVQSVIVWALVSGQAALKETTTRSKIQSLPERAREGLAGKGRPGRRCEADLPGRCARSGADDAAVWGFIEQKCDHFARATWTPASKHMRHDMMREEGRVGRTAEGHANAFRCALYVGMCMCACVRVLCGVVHVLVCVCVCACVCLCV